MTRTVVSTTGTRIHGAGNFFHIGDKGGQWLEFKEKESKTDLKSTLRLGLRFRFYYSSMETIGRVKEKNVCKVTHLIYYFINICEGESRSRETVLPKVCDGWARK